MLTLELYMCIHLSRGEKILLHVTSIAYTKSREEEQRLFRLSQSKGRFFGQRATFGGRRLLKGVILR